MATEHTEKLSITLPAEMVKIIRNKVATGDYASPDQVIREALRLWLDRECRIEALDASIKSGLADAEAGRGTTVDAARPGLRQRDG